MAFDYKKYNKEYRKKHPSVIVYMIIQLHKQLKEIAAKQNISLSKLIVKIIYAYINQTFVCVYDDELTVIIRLLRGVATNINQIAAKLNSIGIFDDANFRSELQQVHRIENYLKELLERPKNLFTYLDKGIEEDPELLDKLDVFVTTKKVERDCKINEMENGT